MKAVNVNDVVAIEVALKRINGKSVAHTYTTHFEIDHVAAAAEQKLQTLGLPKADRIGAKVVATSGEKVPNAYKYSRQATIVILLRKSSGWFLVDTAGTDLYPGQHGGSKVILTQRQADKAHEVFARQFSVQAPARLAIAA